LINPNILNAQTENYGTNRKLKTCPSKSQPIKGSISVAQAKIYAVCQSERESWNQIYFTDISNLQAAPKS
jgi:hypothetical protein